MIIAITVGNESLKVEKITLMILDDEKFKKTSGGNEGGAFVANSSHSRSIRMEIIQKENQAWNYEYIL